MPRARWCAVVVVVMGCASPTEPGAATGSGSAVPADARTVVLDGRGAVVDAAMLHGWSEAELAPLTGSGWSGQRVVPASRLGKVTVTGQLPPEVITRYLRRTLTRFDACAVAPVSISTTFTVGPDGLVTAAKASGGAVASAACVETVLRAIEFPRPTGGTVGVSLTINVAPARP